MTTWRCCDARLTRRLNDTYDFCDFHFAEFFVGPTDVLAGAVIWKVVALVDAPGDGRAEASLRVERM